jgi:type I restriction enzyme S subunit
LIRSMNVHFSGFKPDGLVYLDQTEAGKLEQVTVQKDDVLLNITGASIGRVTTAPPALAGARVNQHVCIIRPKAGLLAPFLAHFLASPDEQARVMNVQVGATRQALTKAMVQNWDVPIPPLPEQRRIVAEIEKQFTRLEAGVAALRRVQANLKRYRAAVLKAACEGRLVPTEAELHRHRVGRMPSPGVGSSKAKGKASSTEIRTEPPFETGEALLARILSERRQWFSRQQAHTKAKREYIEPALAETADLPSLPDGWTWGTWNQISNWVTYGFTRPMPHVDAGIPIVTAKGVNKGRIELQGAHLTTRDAYAKLSQKDRPLPGDILITKDGTIGRAAVVDSGSEFCINQSVAVIWLRSCPIERKFLLAVIESELTQKPIWAKARGVAIQHLSITDFAKMALPIPPLAEQTRIVAEVERRLSVAEELESVVTTNLQRATRLRQSILQKAFTGKLVAQDPSEKAADTQLSRINALPREAKPVKRKTKDPKPMLSKPVTTLEELLQRLDSIGGAAAPERLLTAAGLDEEVETFFDLLREGRDNGALIVPSGTTGDIKRKSHEN